MNNYDYTKKSMVFKKGLLIWGLGTLIAIYFFLRLIFGAGEGVRFLGAAAESSLEKDILKTSLYENKIFEYGKAEFIGVLSVSEFYKENHLFYVSNYPNIGPAFILIQTPKDFYENLNISEFKVFPFMPYSTAEGLSYIKQQFKGYEFKDPNQKEALSKVLKIRSGLEKQYSRKIKIVGNA